MRDINYIAIDTNSFRYISHHGIKGQKWGVRRFQNEDGTLTSAGRKRLDSESAPKQFHSREKKIGEGSVAVEKGRKVESGGPTGMTWETSYGRAKQLRESQRQSLKKQIGNADNAKREIMSNKAKYGIKERGKFGDWLGLDELDRYAAAQVYTQVSQLPIYYSSGAKEYDLYYEKLQEAIDAGDKHGEEYYLGEMNRIYTEVLQPANQKTLDGQAYVEQTAKELANTPLMRMAAGAARTIAKGKSAIAKLKSKFR